MAEPLTRKPCPRCGRTVAWRTLRGPRVNPGRFGAIPALQQPVPHMLPRRVGEPDDWCVSKAGP